MTLPQLDDNSHLGPLVCPPGEPADYSRNREERNVYVNPDLPERNRPKYDDSAPMRQGDTALRAEIPEVFHTTFREAS